MAEENDRIGLLIQEALQLLDEGQGLYRTCAAEYALGNPKIITDAETFTSQINDLFRGLIIKVLHGVVAADRKLGLNEINLCRSVFSRLWGRFFDADQAKSVLTKHSEEPYRWEDLLWPFEKLQPFRDRVVELQTLVMRFGQVAAQADGQMRPQEGKHLQWLMAEMQRMLHPLRADIGESEEVNVSQKKPLGRQKLAQQFQSKYAQEEIDKPLPIPPEVNDLESLLKELEGLIGLAAVKRDVRELVHFLEMQRHRQKHNLPATSVSLHAIFSGNPGTGKTTVARLYGKLLGSLGFLKKGHLIETDRGGLVAEYAGQTAGKTGAKIDEALDGVLFIDEAYSLVSEGEDPYGAEAVQTIVKRMEDQRDRLVVILAGYPQPMEDLLDTNPGLASRFGRTLQFADYSPVELCRIFNTFCLRDQYRLPPLTRAKLLLGFRWHCGRKDERFGNGRLARNVYEASLRRLATRLARVRTVTKEQLMTLDVGDLALDEIPSTTWNELEKLRFETICVKCVQPLDIPALELGMILACQGCQHKQAVEWGEIKNGVAV